MFNDLDQKFREAQTVGASLAVDVLNVASRGPSLALLVLFAAYHEALRAVRTRIPESQWNAFLQNQADLEHEFKRQIAPVLRAARLNNNGQ